MKEMTVSKDQINVKNIKIIHTDNLVTIARFDEIGKAYGISLNDGLNTDCAFQMFEFHTGNPIEGINGISIEGLLAICRDKLEIHNSGVFKCEENTLAIESCTIALNALQARQERRKAEGKLGTQEI